MNTHISISTGLKLQCLNRVVSRFYDSHLARCGMKTGQYALLANIIQLEPVRPTDIAHALHMDNSTVTRTLQTLRERKWVTLTVGRDARSRHVESTERGRDQLQRAARYWRQAQNAFAVQIDEDELSQFHAVLDRLTRKMDQHQVG